MITAADRRRLLEQAWDQAQATGEDLRVVLRRMEDDLAKAVAAGSLQSVTIGGISQTYQGGGTANVTASELLRAISELLDLYDITLAKHPDLAPEQRFRALLAVARKNIRSVGTDMTTFRLTW